MIIRENYSNKFWAGIVVVQKGQIWRTVSVLAGIKIS